MPTALHGMGGVGKTQTAAHYIHLSRYEYALICWVSGETPQTYQEQMAGLAPNLNPSVAIQDDELATFQAVKLWFEGHPDWLLVVDNAEKLPQLRSLLPYHPNGRILLTTRETVPTTFADNIEIHHMDDETGAILLLRRAGIIGVDQTVASVATQTRIEAKAVSAELGGLALAIDQAGAYMQDGPLQPGEYLRLYRQYRQTLHRDYDQTDHQRVEVTFKLALEKVKAIPEVGHLAADLVHLCAFLAPDNIPDEIFLVASDVREDGFAPFATNDASFRRVYTAAGKYALLRRENIPAGLWMHRLAQEVIRDSLTSDDQKILRQWVVFIMNRTFPIGHFSTWSQCEQLLPHALICETYITEDGLLTGEASILLDNTARYLRHRARYSEAVRLQQKSIKIRKQLYGVEHPSVVAALNNLGVIFNSMGSYEEAVAVLEEAEDIARRVLGKDHRDYAATLDTLAGTYLLLQRYAECKPLLDRALDITKRHLGAEDASVAIRLNNIASVESALGHHNQALSLLKEAIRIDCKTVGKNHPDYATHILNMATNYIQLERLNKAVPHLRQALSLRENHLGKEHPATAICHYWLGVLRYRQGRLQEAIDCFQYALKIQENTLGPHHRDTIATRSYLESYFQN